MAERQENFIEYTDKYGNVIVFNSKTCDFYINWKEETTSGMPKSKIVQKEWLALFSKLISNRYKTSNFDMAWDILTPNIEQKQKLLEEILSKEPRTEIKILALIAYNLNSDLLGLEPKPLEYFGIKEQAKEKIIPGQEIKIKPRVKSRRQIEIHLPKIKMHWPRFNVKRAAYAAIGSTIGCIAGFIPLFLYLNDNIKEIENNIHKNKLKCLEMIVSNLKGKAIDTANLYSLNKDLNVEDRDTVITLRDVLNYKEDDDFGRVLSSSSLLVITNKVVPPFGDDPYIITSGMNSIRKRGGDETHRHNALDIVPNLQIDSEKGITWRDIVNHPIYAQASGTVEYAGKMSKYGLMVELIIDKGPYKDVHIRYGHLSYIPKDIDKGTKVKAGTLLGYMGNTGNCEITKDGEKAYHLHWEAFYVNNGKKKHINPLVLLKKTKMNCRETVDLIEKIQNYVKSNTTFSK